MRKSYSKGDTEVIRELFPDDWNYFVVVAFRNIPRRIRERLHEWGLYPDIIGIVVEVLLTKKSEGLSRIEARRLLGRKIYSFLKSWGFRKVRHEINKSPVWRSREEHDSATSEILFI